MALLFDQNRAVIQLTVNKATGAVTLETSEDIAYPIFVDALVSVLQSVTRNTIAQTMAQAGAGGPGAAPGVPDVRFPPGHGRGPVKAS